jgi:glycogen debranching enzyme
MSIPLLAGEAEWLEADGVGGFASGTVSGVRTRRYHGLLVPATMPLRDHLEEAGLSHISEIVDAEPQHTPKGCPFQAWSMGNISACCRLFD